jgi:hypothetical protein
MSQGFKRPAWGSVRLWLEQVPIARDPACGPPRDAAGSNSRAM